MRVCSGRTLRSTASPPNAPPAGSGAWSRRPHHRGPRRRSPPEGSRRARRERRGGRADDDTCRGRAAEHDVPAAAARLGGTIQDVVLPIPGHERLQIATTGSKTSRRDRRRAAARQGRRRSLPQLKVRKGVRRAAASPSRARDRRVAHAGAVPRGLGPRSPSSGRDGERRGALPAPHEAHPLPSGELDVHAAELGGQRVADRVAVGASFGRSSITVTSTWATAKPAAGEGASTARSSPSSRRRATARRCRGSAGRCRRGRPRRAARR